jgi:hypothetical protein
MVLPPPVTVVFDVVVAFDVEPELIDKSMLVEHVVD